MDADQVRSLIQGERLPLSDAARRLGVTYDALAHFCSRHRIHSRKPPPPTIDLDRLRALIEVEKRTQKEAAELLACSRSAIDRWCRRLGLATQRTGPRAGKRHPNWKHGVRIRKGYRYLYVPSHNGRRGAYVAEHRLVMAAAIGRPLLRSEVVHHLNGDPMDNRPENLWVFPSNAEHLRHELKGRIPNWTAAGLEAIRLGVEKAARNRRRAANRRKSAADDPAQPRTIGRRSS